MNGSPKKSKQGESYKKIVYVYFCKIYFVLYFPPFFFFHRPKSGSLLLYSRKKVRYRRDGYCWKKRKDGKTTREDHMKLKVQGTEVSFCFFIDPIS